MDDAGLEASMLDKGLIPCPHAAMGESDSFMNRIHCGRRDICSVPWRTNPGFFGLSLKSL